MRISGSIKLVIFLLCALLINGTAEAISDASSLKTRFYNCVYDSYQYIASHTPQLNEQFKTSYENLKKYSPSEDIKKKFEEIMNDLQREELDSEQQRRNIKKLFEMIGETPLDAEKNTLNDYAFEFIKKHRPELIGTDYSHNPMQTLSYFIMLDPTGFIEKVKIIRGPMNTPMSLKEAFEFYRNLDPAKSAKILKMIESLTTLYAPDSPHDPLDIVIESLNDTIELLDNEEKKKDKK